MEVEDQSLEVAAAEEEESILVVGNWRDCSHERLSVQQDVEDKLSVYKDVDVCLGPTSSPPKRRRLT